MISDSTETLHLFEPQHPLFWLLLIWYLLGFPLRQRKLGILLLMVTRSFKNVTVAVHSIFFKSIIQNVLKLHRKLWKLVWCGQKFETWALCILLFRQNLVRLFCIVFQQFNFLTHPGHPLDNFLQQFNSLCYWFAPPNCALPLQTDKCLINH